MITNDQFYVYYTDYTVLIDEMNSKLWEAQKRNPLADYRISEKNINNLMFLRELFHVMYHDQQTIENDSGKVMIERNKLINRIHRLEKENENLKKDIIL